MVSMALVAVVGRWRGGAGGGGWNFFFFNIFDLLSKK